MRLGARRRVKVDQTQRFRRQTSKDFGPLALRITTNLKDSWGVHLNADRIDEVVEDDTRIVKLPAPDRWEGTNELHGTYGGNPQMHSVFSLIRKRKKAEAEPIVRNAT